jgi:hypothetical protein
MARTTLEPDQIRDNSITDAKVAAGADIATSKLADGASFLQKDGSVALTGDLNAGGQKVTNLGTPSSSGDATPKSYVDAAVAAVQTLFTAKGKARAATTANVTISNPGTDTFDGVTLSSGDVLFVRAQSSTSQQGLYTFNGSGSALTRVESMDTWAELPGAFFAVEEGTTYADTLWLCTANQGGTLGTTSVTFMQVNSSGLSAANFVKEVPSGSVNGSNTAFTITATPVSGSLDVYLNGLLLKEGASYDYTLSGTTITMNYAPATGSTLCTKYMV